MFNENYFIIMLTFIEMFNDKFTMIFFHDENLQITFAFWSTVIMPFKFSIYQYHPQFIVIFWKYFFLNLGMLL